MRYLIADMFLISVVFFAYFVGPSIQQASASQTRMKLEQKKYSCPFICLRFSKSGTLGVIYEGHEDFKLFITGNKFEDDFETRVLNKANVSCKGNGTAKLVDFQSKQFLIADGVKNDTSITKVMTIKNFSPATHCVEEKPLKKKN